MTSFELTPRRAAVLTALLNQPGGEIQDPDGQATALLMTETGHRTTNALSGVLQQLEVSGYIERDVSGGRRTYRIALTKKGRDAAKELASGRTVVEPAPDVAAGVDLDLLAGVLLKKALLATQAQEGAAQAKDAERRAAELEAELRAARNELAEQRALIKTLEHNNQVLANQMDKVRNNPGRPIKELISRKEQQELEKLMRSLPTSRG